MDRYPVDHASLPTKLLISTNEASARREPLGPDAVVYTEYAKVIVDLV
jgi:hypothetical protein